MITRPEDETEPTEGPIDGRKTDVFIEDIIIEDKKTGMKSVSDELFMVWADSGLSRLIYSIPGVTVVMENPKCRYTVGLDKRYDMDFVKKEVEAEILCRKEKPHAPKSRRP